MKVIFFLSCNSYMMSWIKLPELMPFTPIFQKSLIRFITKLFWFKLHNIGLHATSFGGLNPIYLSIYQPTASTAGPGPPLRLSTSADFGRCSSSFLPASFAPRCWWSSSAFLICSGPPLVSLWSTCYLSFERRGLPIFIWLA